MKEKEWWEYLDWSTMKRTWDRLPKELKQKIIAEGFWSKGKEIFEETVSSETEGAGMKKNNILDFYPFPEEFSSSKQAIFRHKLRKKLPKECEKCGAKRDLTIHHKNGIASDNRLCNLQILCKKCHLAHHKRVSSEQTVPNKQLGEKKSE